MLVALLATVAVACEPFDGLKTTRIARRGDTVTEFFEGAYDVESAATHETGHSIGLGHTSATRYPTMYHQLCAGCTFARTLGRGDVRA